MKVSIITPAFNCETTIEATYNSIRSQTHTDWEWLVTEDCSSDNTKAKLKEIAQQDGRVKIFFNSRNSGAAVSRNNSLSHVKGDFVAFIDSDDLWLPTKLEKQLAFMVEGINFSFTSYELINSEGNSLNKFVDTKQKHPLSYSEMLRKKATLGCSTVILRACAFEELSMPLVRTGQDYALWLKILKLGHKAYPLASSLTQYRILPNSISRNKLKKAKRQWQIYREIECLPILLSAECFLFYAWRAIFRK